MPRTEYQANEALATPYAKRAGRVHYEVTRNAGPVEITVKILAFVAVLATIVYLMAQAV